MKARALILYSRDDERSVIPNSEYSNTECGRLGGVTPVVFNGRTHEC